MPPEQVLRNEQRLGSRTIDHAAEELAGNFNAERIALAIATALHGAELSALKETLSCTRDRAAEILATMHLPHLPGREQLAARAKAMFVSTKSLDDIIDRAYNRLLVSVGLQLAAA
jgi:stearoyl-CoA desaturase (delta-9 desaturase)